MPGSRKGSLQSERSFSNGRRANINNDDVESSAAYLRVVETVDESIHTRQELTQVLQYAGKNPTGKQINAIWSNCGGAVTFEEFCKLTREMKSTSKAQLITAFKRIDINGDGFISEAELYKMLTSRGEKMTHSEVKKILDMSDVNNDGKLDYKEFSSMMLSTSNQCKNLNMQRLEPTHSNPYTSSANRPVPAKRSTSKPGSAVNRVNNQNEQNFEDERPSSRQSSASAASRKEAVVLQRLDDAIKVVCSPPAAKAKSEQPKSLKGWNHAHSKGCLLLDEGPTIVSHVYNLELPFASNVWITIKPYTASSTEDKLKSSIDVGVFVFRESENGESTLVAATELKEGLNWCWRGDLRSGTYKVVPFTSGCRLKPRLNEPYEDMQLVRKDQNNKFQLSGAFRSALSDVFEMCDLDGNGLLSRDELNWYQKITVDEEVDDETWQVVVDKVEVKNDQITREGFVGLHLMQAQEDGLEAQQDFMDMIKGMGYSGSLELDQACPFELHVYTKDCAGSLSVDHVTSATDDEMGAGFVESALVRNVTHKLASTDGLVWYVNGNEHRTTTVLDNKTSRTIQCMVDCSKSRNCITQRAKDSFALKVPSHQKVVVDHALPAGPGEWSYHCSITNGTDSPQGGAARKISSASRRQSAKKETNLLDMFD